MKAPLISVFFACAATCSAAVTQYGAHLAPLPYWPENPNLFFSVTSTNIGLFVSNSLPNNFTFEYGLIAEAYRLFEVEAGDAFNADYVNSQPNFVNNYNNPGTGTFSLSLGQSKYLAYWFEVGPSGSSTALDSDLYGWALFTNIGGQLVVSDSATADSGGIIVGTLDQIPEPACTLMCFVSIGASLLSRRRI